jgi:hypothetical protein
MAATDRFKLLTFREAFSRAQDKADDPSLYVLNTSPRGSAGRINLSIVGTNGQRTAVQVPREPGPIDVSLQAMKIDILNCPDFRRIVAAGYMKIVDSDSAEDFFLTPEGKKFSARINKISADEPEDELSLSEIAENNGVDMTGETELIPKGVGPFTQNIVYRATQDSEDVDALLSDLEAQADILNTAEIDFLMQRCTASEIKEWAATIRDINNA